MSKSYLPGQDTEFLAWAQTFSTYLFTHAAELGIEPAAAQAITTSVDSFGTSIGSHNAAQQAAKSSCQLKDDNRDGAETRIRSMVRQLQASPSVTDEQRLSLGITVRGERVLSPMVGGPSRPMGSCDTSQRMRHELRYGDESTPTRRARPVWAMGAEIWCKVTAANEPAPLDPGAYSNLGLNTASPFVVDYGGADAGKMAHYILRWASRDGAKGPWSEIISATIVG